MFLAALFLIIARFLSVWTGIPFPVDLVTSDSMEPDLMKGDIVAWTPASYEDVEVGDVVVFKSHIHWPDEKIVVHRVSAIEHTSSGEKLLETKGDNNDWTDQAGPHIPEPYIREGNLMGKVVSIGQTPLKIPYIGLIGIWLNEGLDLISQPTQAKGSVGYAGIFAPLTISAVVLVVLIFLLPEKARTVKEKIRYYIFGPRPLNMKRTLISFLIAYIIFFTVIHSFAFDSTTASVGIGEKSEDMNINFGQIKQGTESFPKSMPVINPSAMAVKGVVFGKGELKGLVSIKTFELEQGQKKSVTLTASATDNNVNGTYTGDIVMYSSPFWLLFPDSVIEYFYNIDAEWTVYILDFLSAFILTAITVLMLVSITFIGNKTSEIVIDHSWKNPARLILNKKIVKRTVQIKNILVKDIKNGMSRIMEINFLEKKVTDTDFGIIGKPLIAALCILPIIYLVEDQISAMIISVFIAGVIAYMISCKIRQKIVLAILIALTLSVSNMIIQSNLIIRSQSMPTLELLALTLSATGVYLLLLSFCLIPFSIIGWLIVRVIRNVKERKDPLLSLEGSCDL